MAEKQRAIRAEQARKTAGHQQARRGAEQETPDFTEERLREEGSLLSYSELQDVEKRLRLRAAVVYEIIRQQGEEELVRPNSSLLWSGIAAGLSIGFSILAKALLEAYAPDADWKPLIVNLGYSIGFLIVIMGRQQLFTENTLTAVLPLLGRFRLRTLRGLLRLWVLVFCANMVGTFLFACAMLVGTLLDYEQTRALYEISLKLTERDAISVFYSAIFAGWLMAAIVWLLPSAEGAGIFVIILLTYLIGLGEFAHVVAGSVEAFLLFIRGEWSFLEAFIRFILPALAGNIIGGATLFGIIAYGQVKEEI